MKVGVLKHRGTFYSAGVTRSGIDRVPTWTEEGSRWMEIMPVSGKEGVEHQAVRQSVTHKVTIRHWADVDPSWKIVCRGRVFQIESVLNWSESDKTMILQVKEMMGATIEATDAGPFLLLETGERIEL